MTPFFTAEGDSGETGILGPGRVSKTSSRIEAVGTVDEAASALGLARSLATHSTTKRMLLHIQRQLYQFMTEISSTQSTRNQFDLINAEDVDWLEEQIGSLENQVELPKDFIVSGSCPSSGALSLARTIIRRAERRVIVLFESKIIQKEILIAYLNRLSSLIFVLEIFEINQSGKSIELAKKE
jgi:cob(I)alamin adenosyltransferase